MYVPARLLMDGYGYRPLLRIAPFGALVHARGASGTHDRGAAAAAAHRLGRRERAAAGAGTRAR